MRVIFISLVINFFSIWVLLTLFDHRIDNKIKRIFILTIFSSAVSFLSHYLGFFGSLVGSVINFIAVMKILGYDFFTTLLFSLGVEIVASFFIFGVFKGVF